MTVPAAPAVSGKLPWWTFVKESYGEWKSMAALFRAGWLVLLIQLGITVMVTNSLFGMVKVAQQVRAMEESASAAEGASYEGDSGDTTEIDEAGVELAGQLFSALGSVAILCLVGAILALAFRGALYRWQMSGELPGFINPLMITGREWRMLWYGLKSWWYSLVPSFLMALSIIIPVAMGAVGAALVMREKTGLGGALAFGGLLFIPLMIWAVLIYCRRVAVLSCATPGIYEENGLRMWKDVWKGSKGVRWAVLWGLACIPLEAVTYTMSQAFSSDEALNWVVNIYENYPVQIYLAAALLTLLWFAMVVPKVAFETRCYRFIKERAAK